MWNQRIEQEVGRRIHRLVAYAVSTECSLEHLSRHAQEMFASEPIGGALAASIRSRCVNLTRLYLTRCEPIGWELVGVEEQLGHSRIDTVWANPSGRLFGEELKKGRPTMSRPAMAEQATREFRDLHDRFGSRFAGLRVVTLGAPDRSWMLVPDGTGRMRRSTLLPGLEIR